MRHLFFKISMILLSCFIPFGVKAQKVVVLNLNTPIYSVTAQYIENGLQQAVSENAACVILKINTPGGLLEPTRKIVGDILESPVPVISFVTPSGAHAGSAGAFIALAANVCAMSPGTNIGASHPVLSIGNPDSVMNEKMTQDAVAFIRSIAEKRNRDTSLIIQMVANSRSFSAEQALKNHVIDLMANNVQDLLKKVNGHSVQTASGATLTLQTSNASVENVEMGGKEKLLNTLNDPNVMYLLLIVGILGIVFEFFHPGGLAPGVIGVVCLILAAYGMSLLPVNYTGLALIVLAIILFILELKFPSYALLSISAVVCLFLGSVFLIKKEPSFDVVQISWSVLITSVIVTGAFFILLIVIGLKAQSNRITTGRSALVGKKGIAMENLAPQGRVKVNGEFWEAENDGKEIVLGAAIEVISVKHFKLTVKELPLTSK